MASKKDYIKFLILDGMEISEIDEWTHLISSPEFQEYSQKYLDVEFLYKSKDLNNLYRMLGALEESDFNRENDSMPVRALKAYIELVQDEPELPLVAINPVNFVDAMDQYKLSFIEKWDIQCGQKWNVLSHAHDVWNIKSKHFNRMWNRFVSKPFTFCVKDWAFSTTYISLLAKKDKDAVCAMFKNLLDEEHSLQYRLQEFSKQAETMDEEIYSIFGKSHQNIDAITMYLWMISPDKYFFYDYEKYSLFAQKIGLSWEPLENKYNNNFKYILDFFAQVKDYIKQDPDLIRMNNDCLKEEWDIETVSNVIALDFIQYVAETEVDN